MLKWSSEVGSRPLGEVVGVHSSNMNLLQQLALQAVQISYDSCRK